MEVNPRDNPDIQNFGKKVDLFPIIGIITILVNLSAILCIMLSNSELLGWIIYLYYFIPLPVLNITCVILARNRIKQHSLSVLSRAIFAVCIITLISTFILLTYASETDYFSDKSDGIEKIYTEGTLVGEYRQYAHPGYGIVLKYSKSWNLFIQKNGKKKYQSGSTPHKLSFGENIIITQRDRRELKSGNGIKVGLTIWPQNDAPLSDSEIAKKLDEYRLKFTGLDPSALQYLGMETIDGKDYPYFSQVGGGSVERGSDLLKRYLFANRGILFFADYRIYSDQKQYEPLLLDIIRSIRFQ